jgi:hypothetical protein
MKILSIDVGIKNLAFCLFDNETTTNANANANEFAIKKWNSINVSEKIVSVCGFIEKNSQICGKPAKFTKGKDCFCLKHSKKQNFIIPTSELKKNFIQKQKIQKLFDLADKYKITYKKPVKKDDLIELINEYIEKTCFDPISFTNANKIDLVTIGENIKIKLDEILLEEGKIEYIIIENQISPIANRMKTIQGLITQYFIMRENYNHIEFISAINKLKDTNEVKADKSENTYSNRKKMGITKCLEFLNNKPLFYPMLEYFSQHSKKDDLADSFLQGLWYISNKLP